MVETFSPIAKGCSDESWQPFASVSDRMSDRMSDRAVVDLQRERLDIVLDQISEIL